MKKIIAFIIIVLILISGGAYYFIKINSETIENIKPDDKNNLITVASPIKNAEVSSPLRIAGRARGVWFFEGSFPVTLVDSYGNVIAESYVTAQGEWMTEDFVPFTGSLQFNNYIKGSSGSLILKKDNPSGLPENDDSVEIPVTFK